MHMPCHSEKNFYPRKIGVFVSYPPLVGVVFCIVFCILHCILLHPLSAGYGVVVFPLFRGVFSFSPLRGGLPAKRGEVQTQLTPIQIIDRFIVLFFFGVYACYL